MEPQNDDHWNSLAQKIGAEVKPEQPVEQPPTAAPAPPRAEVKRAPAPAPPSRASTNWSQLASSLGLEAAPEESPPPPARAAAAHVPAPEKLSVSPSDSLPAERDRIVRTPASSRDDFQAAEGQPREAEERSESPGRAAEASGEPDRPERGRHDRGGERGRGDRGRGRGRGGRDHHPPDRAGSSGSERKPADAPRVEQPAAPREPIFNDPDEPVYENDSDIAYSEIVDAEIVEEFSVGPAEQEPRAKTGGHCDSTGEQRGPSGRRRRRRRRGGRSGSRRGDAAAEAEDRAVGEDVPTILDEPSETFDERLDADDQPGQPGVLGEGSQSHGGGPRREAAGQEGESDGRRGRRRRRRRGSRDRRPSGEATASRSASPEHRHPDPRDIDPRDIDPRDIDPRDIDPRDIDPRDIDPRSIRPRVHDVIDHEDDDDHDEEDDLDDAGGLVTADSGFDGRHLDDEDDDPDGPVDHHSHRGIPAWSDAIGFIVDANLEARSKSPNRSGAPRGRRGRGRSGPRDRGDDRS